MGGSKPRGRSKDIVLSEYDGRFLAKVEGLRVGSAKVQRSRMEKGLEVSMVGVEDFWRITEITSWGRSLREGGVGLGVVVLRLRAGVCLRGGLGSRIRVMELSVGWEGMGGWSNGIGGASVGKQVGWIIGRWEEDLRTKSGGGGD
ncbi:hypothetical protein AAC387_Pa12g1210 [Persea americana]